MWRAGFVPYSNSSAPRKLVSLSAIHFAAVPDAVDSHDANLVRDFINYAVITNPNAPVMFTTGELSATGRTRIRSQRVDRLNYAVVNVRGEAREILFCRAFEEDSIHRHLRLRSAR